MVAKLKLKICAFIKGANRGSPQSQELVPGIGPTFLREHPWDQMGHISQGQLSSPIPLGVRP